jgi:NAD(P)-dependent dehydrogenase (short-subunit alcohol dehydrogenase family)
MRWTSAQLPDLSGRTVVVTGGNSGIGWHTADALAEHGAHVVLACRDLVRAERAVARIAGRRSGRVTAAGLDLSVMSSVRSFAQSWTGPLHVLVNNAGVMAPPKRAQTADGYELQFGTNHLGHFVLTGLLLPALLEARSARVVTVSSVAHHGGDADVVEANAGAAYDAQHAYSNSKLANLLFADELQRQLQARELPVDSLAAHPGVAATGLVTDAQGMGANRVVRVGAPIVLRLFTQSAHSGARAVLYAATQAEPGSYTGPQRFGETRGRIGTARRSAQARDAALARRLWRVSEEMTGFVYPWQAAQQFAAEQLARQQLK